MSRWKALVPPWVAWVPVGVAVNDCLVSVLPVRDGESGGLNLILINKLSPRMYDFRRGRLALLKSPNDPHVEVLRRLVAVEGDWVRLENRRGPGVEKIPAGRCWVESGEVGSADSEDWGSVPLALIQGHAVATLWPPARWGAIPRAAEPGRVVAHAAPDPHEDPWKDMVR